MKHNCVNIYMLDGIKIEYEDYVYDLESELGKQLINLFQILAIRMGQEVFRDELIELLYQDSEDPRNVLKFTVFRLRKALKSLKGLEDFDFIQTTKKGYQLSNEYKYYFDFNDFLEETKIMETKEDINYEDSVQKLLDLYCKPLYTTKNAPLIIKQTRMWYATRFERAIIKVCQSLLELKKIDEMITLATTAIQKSYYSEDFHYFLMTGFIEQGEYHKALQYYDDLNEAFVKEMGFGLSEQFKSLYNSIEHVDFEESLTLTDIMKDLNSKQKRCGGFYCDYDLFKKMYEVVRGYARRENTNSYLIMIEVVNRDFSSDSPITISNKLKVVIEKSLRMNDIFTRLQTNRYLICAKCHTIDDAYIITERISSLFYRKMNRDQYRIVYDVKESN